MADDPQMLPPSEDFPAYSIIKKRKNGLSFGRAIFLYASVTFSSDNKKFKRTPKSDKVLGDQTKKL